jgi:Zn-dependent protease with chaperone function
MLVGRMDEIYPPGPANVPPALTQPTTAYKRHAYLAVAGVLLFLAAYAALTGWFAWTSYRLLTSISRAPDKWLPLGVGGVAAGFLAILMIKAVIFIRRGQHEGEIEVTQASHPRLFAFLHRLADEARAPRPHRVFLSPRVNAGVYYDLSIANLILPSRKNLEIGLGLINVLTLAEVKAVLAHEFGHFAQRTMAVGRWVYIAQQIAAHVVAKRDALDRMLHWISSIDLRVAWIGWILRLIVWSIRSLIETVFGWVILAQRALSREMELQADLVAVSLTGSDALIHALHRLDAADDAMERAMSFADSQRHAGKAVADLFTIQSEMLVRTRTILDDPRYGQVPALPPAPQAHRLFKAQLAQPPRMWSTHPANDVREDNAKRDYIAAPLDDRSAWVLFEDPEQTRKDITAALYVLLAKDDESGEKPQLETPTKEETLDSLAKSFDRRFFDSAYRGVYLGRSVVRAADTVAGLYGPVPADVTAELATLYPATLSAELEKMRELTHEKAMLGAVERGILQAPGGIVRYRGQDHHRRDLPALVAQVESELTTTRGAITEHDKRVRATHLAAARQLSPAWEAYLRGLAAILHYADHREADLEDAMGALENVVAIVLADRKVTSGELERLVFEARDIYNTLEDVHREAPEVELGALTGKLEVASWREMLGETFALPPPQAEIMGDWLGAVHSWVGAACGALSRLSSIALDELLRAEHEVAQYVTLGTPAPEAPAPPRVPTRYATLVTGKERPRQLQLGWWDRFQVADGFAPGAARFLCAGAIVAGVVLAGRTVGHATVHVVNGLNRGVIVEIGDHEVNVPPRGHAAVEVDSGEDYAIRTRTTEGKLIESFEAGVDDAFGHYVYDVARATPLLEFDPETNSDRSLGAPRWISTRATRVYDDPASVYVRSTDPPVIASIARMPPVAILANAGTDADAIAAAHVRWDPPGTPNLEAWYQAAGERPGLAALLDEKIAAEPDEVLPRRLEQERGPRAEVCTRHRKRAAEQPQSPAWQYLAMRCIDGEAARNEAVVALAAKWPDDPWILYAHAGALADRGDLDAAERMFERASQRLPDVRQSIAVMRVRVGLLNGSAIPDDVVEQEPALAVARDIERGTEDLRPELATYRHLFRGELAAAAAKAQGTDAEPTIAVLVACSAGATPEQIERGALAADKLSAGIAVYAYALALKTGRDPSPYRNLVTDADRDLHESFAFVDAVAAAKPATDLGTLQPPVDFTTRARAYAAASVLLGDKLPEEWRTFARRALFVFERPYLR